MKTILSILLLMSLNLMAQGPEPHPLAAGQSDRAAALRRLIPPPAAQGAPAAPTAQPAAPDAQPSIGVPAPAAPPAATPVPAAPANPDPAASATPAPAAPVVSATPAPEEETIPPGHINWTAATLDQVLTYYAEMVGRSILRAQGLPAPQIVFKNQTALTKAEFIQALDALLALNNVAMIMVGEKFVKAVPVAQAGNAGGAMGTNDSTSLPDLGGYRTHIVQLKYIKPSEALTVITPFASAGMAPPIPIETSQMLVIRDNAENVKRMLEMLEKVDITVPSEFISEVIPIKFAKVADIAAALNSLSGGGGGTTVGSHSTRPAGSTSYSPGMTQPGRTGTGYNTPGMNPQGTLGSQGTPSSGASFSDRIKSIINRASTSTGGSGDLQIIGVTKIVADERSNSLLIFATRQDMTMIKDIISKLDVVLAQVIIETVIMEVDVSDGWNFGVSALEKPHNVGSYFTGVGAINNVGFLSGANFGGGVSNALGQGFSYFGKLGNDLDVTITAAAQDSTVTIIQKPRVQTSHATPASIFIGQTVPYVSGTYYGGGAYGNSSSYQQLSVGIGLNVTPFINADGLVVMQIDETIDELGPTVKIDNNDVPQTKHRTVTAEVAVRDRETVILGGFIRDQNDKGKSGVPILKDIPILGYLFNTTSKKKDRKELIVLMRPTVLRTPELAAAYTTEEKARLPGIRQAEWDNEQYEEKRIKAADRALEKKRKAKAEEEAKQAEKDRKAKEKSSSKAAAQKPAGQNLKQQDQPQATTPAKPEQKPSGRDASGFLPPPEE